MSLPTIEYYWGFDAVEVVNGSSITYIDHQWVEESNVYLTVENITNLESGSWVNDVHTYIGANYSFKEWNTSRDGTGTKYNVGATVTGQVTLYAIWEPLEVKPETMDLRDNDLLYKINLLTDAERAKIVAALTQHQDISGKADNGAIADEYDETTVYSEGDRCTKAGKYYSRKSWGADTPAAESWDATHWDEICMDDLITAEAGARAAADTAINQAAAKQKATVGIVEDGNTATQAISAGQYVIWKGDLYTADSNISSSETLASSGGSKNLTAVSGGGLNALNSKLDYATLINGETITSTSTNKTLYNGRKFSDYRLILAIVKRVNSYRASMMIPIGLFASDRETLLFEVDSINSQRWYNIVYINNTTVAVQCSANADSEGYLYIYGML